MGERLRFGAFIGPFHARRDNPSLALHRDLKLVSLLDELGFDECWIGEHHSGGMETIGTPEMFIATAAERTRSIRLGTGVVSLPYHSPLMLAERINAEGLRIDGRPAREILGRHILEVWPESEHLPPWQLYQRAMAERTPGEVVYRHRSDKHDVWLEVRAYPVGQDLAVFYRDVTDREIAQVRPPAQLPGVPAYEARLWLRPGLASGLAERRRSMVGPVGCGLCGVDSIAAALPQVVRLAEGARFSPQDVGRAMQALSEGQRRWRETPAIHAAGFWSPEGATVREDVGRHNALDKLAGALADRGVDARAGAIVMSSRLSVDLVQKTARIGAPVLIGASTPTRLAIAWAEAAGITLIGRARGDAFDLYTHPQRMKG